MQKPVPGVQQGRRVPHMCNVQARTTTELQDIKASQNAIFRLSLKIFSWCIIPALTVVMFR